MEKEKSSTTVLKNPIKNLQSADISTVERLLNTSDRMHILDLLKPIKGHSVANVLKGFRPLPENWPTIFKRLTSPQVLNDPRILQNVHVKGWLEGNQSLFVRFLKEIDSADVEQALFRLLVEIDSDGDTLTRLWCCLLLDGREATQQAFNNGLSDALLDENSPLRVMVKLAKQIKVLEQDQQQIQPLQDEVDLWKLRYEQEAEERRRAHNTYEVDHTQQTETIAKLDRAIADLQAEKARTQENFNQIRKMYEQEQDKTNSLHSEVTQLKQNLAEARQQLDEVREENVQLKSNEKRLTEWGKTIETERDAEIRKRRELQKQLEEANRDKETQERLKQTTINQYHQLQARMKQSGTEIAKYHSLSPSQLDAAWQQSLTILSQHFSSSLAQPQRERHNVTNEEKLADWQYWQEEEDELVYTLFSSPQLEHATYLMQVEKAQRLLLVRWYLLEWLRSTASQSVVGVANDHESQD